MLEALVVGAIQGITEWLPISSQGINSLVMIKFFGKSFAEVLSVSLALHIGTLFAALIYFRKDIVNLVDLTRVKPSFFSVFFKKRKTETERLCLFIVVGTFFSLLVGIPLFFLLEKINFPGKTIMILIGVLLVVTGIVQISKKTGTRKKIENKDGFVVGIAQGFSVLPGLSRSGLTLATLLFRKVEGKQALRLSFLLSIPIVFLLGVFVLLTQRVLLTLDFLVAVITSFVFGLITISLLMKIAGKINFGWFAVFIGFLAILSGFL